MARHRQLVWAVVLVLGVVSVGVGLGAAPESPPPAPLPPPTPPPPPPLTNHTGICGSVDARNNVTELQRKLRGCRVIEGFLHVVLMDNTNASSFLNVSFPELREITSYLLVHRVKGLQSLGALFPNLAVIRGQVLWVDHGYIRYSLMVYQLEDLKEVALASLTNVLRGAVRIGKVPQLCYVHTIDWEAIVASKEIYIDAPECGREREPCPESCNSSRCWGPHQCQGDGVPRWCDAGGCRRCHRQCLGGCDGPGPDHCYACRGVLHDGRCVSACPSTGELRFEFIGRRCVSEEQCRREPLPPGGSKVPGLTWIPFQGGCRLECPEDHQMVGAPSGYAACVPCRGRCRKVCGDGRESVVRTLADMDKFRQCTHVDGSLTFSLAEDEHDLSEELPSRFGLIQEINGHLKVTRSFGLRSLDFLRSLRVIHGGDSADKPALVVMSNDNLQALWDWRRRGPSPEFSIRRGGLLFHDNPRLCLAEIERLRDVARMDDFTAHDVSPVSNGYLASCGRVSFDAEAKPLNETAAEVRWDSQGLTQSLQGVIGYVLHYSVADQHQAAHAADECHTDAWKMEFAMLPLEERRAVLSGLRPHTRYQLYVRAYFSDSVRDGSRSAVLHFTTPAGRPSAPRRLRAVAAPGLPTAEAVALRWQPPLHPRGDLLEYVVRVRALPEGDLRGRDYCARPPRPSPDHLDIDDGAITSAITTTTTAVVPSPATEPARHEGGRRCCSCEPPRPRCSLELYSRFSQSRLLDWLTEADDLEELDSAEEAGEAGCLSAGFHRLLHDDLLPRAAAADDPLADTGADVGSDLEDTEGETAAVAVRVPAGNLTTELRQLAHFSRYVARVQACNDGGRCSPAALVTFRTAARREADAVQEVHVSSATWEVVHVQWRGPESPNGALLAYYVEWGRGEGQRDGQHCQLARGAANHTTNWEEFHLKRLSPGEYWVRVASLTLAGPGPFCDRIPFAVPLPPVDKSHGSGLSGGDANDGGGHGKQGPRDRVGVAGAPDYASSATRTALTAVGVAAVLLAVGAGTALLLWWRCLAARRDVLLATVNPEYISLAKYVPDEWEVSRDKVTLVRELATGSFGKVYEGVLMPCGERCAVKTVSERATARERLEFLHEANVMKRFTGAHHVVRLLGVVSRGQPPLVLMELMHRGDLKGFLRAAREPEGEERALLGGEYQEGLPLSRVLRMAGEIADGMAYLEAVKFVHRDLAARNCMVAHDLTVKIGDFGMTRDVYENDYYRKSNKGLLPVRWMAPESLQDGIFSSLTDVWSYGVVLWEISTLAEQPYQGLSNEQVLSFVLGGGRLPRPPDAAPAVWAVCQACWQTSPALRPTFLQLVRSLDSLGAGLGADFAEVSFYHSEAAVALRDGADSLQRPPPPTVYGYLPEDLDETLF